MVNHIRERTSGRQAVGSDTLVGGVTFAGCIGKHYVHHGLGVAGGGTYFDALFSQFIQGIDDSGNGVGVVCQGSKKVFLEFGVHICYVLFVPGTVIEFLKLLAYSVHLEQFADVVYLGHSHRAAGLFHRDVDAYFIEGFQEGGYRSETSVIDRRACPVHNDTFYSFHVYLLFYNELFNNKLGFIYFCKPFRLPAKLELFIC